MTQRLELLDPKIQTPFDLTKVTQNIFPTKNRLYIPHEMMYKIFDISKRNIMIQIGPINFNQLNRNYVICHVLKIVIIISLQQFTVVHKPLQPGAIQLNFQLISLSWF